jgi:hypothetical protein
MSEIAAQVWSPMQAQVAADVANVLLTDFAGQTLYRAEGQGVGTLITAYVGDVRPEVRAMPGVGGGANTNRVRKMVVVVAAAAPDDISNEFGIGVAGGGIVLLRVGDTFVVPGWRVGRTDTEVTVTVKSLPEKPAGAAWYAEVTL